MKILKDLWDFTIDNFYQLKVAGVYSAFGSLFCMIPFSISDKINIWLQGNIDYVSIALFSIGVAHVLGTIVHHYFKNDFDIRKNIIGFCIMLLMVVVVGLLMEGLAQITKPQDYFYTYTTMVGRLIVVIYPIRSALRNVKIITNGAFPPDAIIGKLDRFNENLDLSEFKDKSDVENYNQNFNNENNQGL